MLGGHGITRPLSRFRHPDLLMKIVFDLGLFGFRELVQNIRRLVYPAPLGFGGSEDFGQGFPESHGPVSHGQFGIDRQSPCLQIEQQRCSAFPAQ